MTALQTVLFISNHGDVRGGGEISLLGLLDGLRRSSSWRPLLVVPEEGTVAVKSRAMDIPTYVIPMPTLRKMTPGGLRIFYSWHGSSRPPVPSSFMPMEPGP